MLLLLRGMCSIICRVMGMRLLWWCGEGLRRGGRDDAWESGKRIEDDERDKDGRIWIAVASCAILGVAWCVGIMSNLWQNYRFFAQVAARPPQRCDVSGFLYSTFYLYNYSYIPHHYFLESTRFIKLVILLYKNSFKPWNPRPSNSVNILTRKSKKFTFNPPFYHQLYPKNNEIWNTKSSFKIRA